MYEEVRDMENPIENPQIGNETTTTDFWAVLDVVGQEFDIEEQNVEVQPQNVMAEAQIESEGKPINLQKLKRRMELENRRKTLHELEVREKVKRYAKLIDAVISRFGRDNGVLLEALYWKEVLKKPNTPIGTLEDFVKWIEPLIKAQPEKEAQQKPENLNKAQQFLNLLQKAKAKRKPTKKPETDNKTTTKPEFTITARFRLYIKRGTRTWLIYTDTLQLERLKEFKATQFDRYVRTGINGVYLTIGDFITVPVKKDELAVLKRSKEILPLMETIRAIETVRQERAKRRQVTRQQVKNAVIGFYRLFGRF